jgi:hypothetical protein
MKVGDAVRFSKSSACFAVIIKEKESNVALMFKDGDVMWFKKAAVESVNGDA